MLVIEPTKGRWLTDWSEINWTAVEGNVKRVQRRIFRAAKTRQRGLEPRAGRLACVVLRGLGGGNIARLPDTAKPKCSSPLFSPTYPFCRTYFFVVKYEKRNPPTRSLRHILKGV